MVRVTPMNFCARNRGRHARPLLPLLLLTAAAAAAPGARPVVEEVRLVQPRAGHQATPIADGGVLVTGGCRGAGCTDIQATVEHYDPLRRRFTPGPGLRQPRVAHAASALPDGRVLVAGGWTGGATTASTELHDPRSGRFEAGPDLSVPRMDGTATVLDDGDVLLVGGASHTNRPVARIERFVAATGRIEPAGDLAIARAHHAAVKLRDGRVLVVGGLTGRHQASASAEIVDPRTGTVRPTGSLLQPRCKHAAVPLADGRVMVLAGSSDCNDRTKIGPTEIYDPATGRFSPGPTLQDARYKVASAALALPDGRVLIAGDAADVEVWVPGSPAFTRLTLPQGAGLAFSTATALPDGEVLVLGGYDADVVPTARGWRLALPPR